MSKRPASQVITIVPLASYILVSLAATWPLVIHMHGWVAGFGDWGQNMWALWWTRHALLVLAQNPFFTDYLFYPEGVTLLFHPLDVSDGLLALPLYGLFGGDVSYNFIILLSFALGGWGAYLLALVITGHRPASFVAGLIFTLSPYHFQRVDLGHLNLATIQWIPFYTLFLLRFAQRGSKRQALFAIFFLVFNALNSWYYVVYCGLLSLAALFWPGLRGWRAGQSRWAGRISFVLGTAGLILSPLLWPMFHLLGDTTLIGAHNPLRHSVDLLSFWVPGPPLAWASWFEPLWISYAGQNREPGASAFIGYTVLILSTIGLIQLRRRRQAVWWLVVGLGFTLLALGPQLQIDGHVLQQRLPYHWLTTLIPLFAITGIPGRLVVMTSLALAMLAACGLAALAQWQPARRANSLATGPARVGLWLCIGVGILVSLEYLAAPLRLSRTDVADFYHILAADTETYAILDIKWDANFLMQAQTIHGKPLIGGWLARLPEEQAAYLNQGSLERAFLYLLLGGETATGVDGTTIQPAIRTALAERDVRYIIDHNHTAGPWLDQFVGWPVVYTDEDIVIYSNRPLD